MSLGTDILFLILLLILSGFFSGAEVALVSLSKFKAKHMVSQKRLGATYILKLKDDPQRMLATILIGNNIVNVAAAAWTTSIVIRFFENYAVGIATGIVTFLLLIFGELTPKAIATRRNEHVCQLVATPIWYLGIIMAPIINVLDTFLDRFIKLLGIKTAEKKITEAEIISMLKAAEDEGSIKATQKTLISNIFEFEDMDVQDIITPITDMVTIESKSNLKRAIKLMLKSNFSRLPVYEGTKERIVGIVYIKDVTKRLYSGKSNLTVGKVLNKPLFVPNTKKISSLLRQFQQRKEHMAIVVDEHGSLKGLVTMEDVLEEIVGEIIDETEKLDPKIRKISKNVWLVNGKTDVDELNSKLKMELSGENYDTLSGLILKQTGKIPKEGEEIIFKNFKFKIEDIELNRINMVRIEKIA